MDRSEFLRVNRAAWDQVAPQFFGGTALPEYGPLALTEDDLCLIDDSVGAALELGFGSRHSLVYLYKHKGIRDLWGVDLSSEQHLLTTEFLASEHVPANLLVGSMNEDLGIPTKYFDLVISIYGLGWTPDLARTLALIQGYLKPGGTCIYSWEHPVYHCIQYQSESDQYIFAKPYISDGLEIAPSWKGDRAMIPHPTLAEFINSTIRAGLQIDQVIESPVNLKIAKDANMRPSDGTPCRALALFQPR